MQDKDEAQEWLTVKEAAQMLHVSHRGLCNMLAKGGIAGEKGGGEWCIRRAEVLRKLAQDAPEGFFVKQSAQTVELAGGRVWRFDRDRQTEVT